MLVVNNGVLEKILDYTSNLFVEVDGEFYRALKERPDDATLEQFREYDDAFCKNEGSHLLANFLPDGERPADIPKY